MYRNHAEGPFVISFFTNVFSVRKYPRLDVSVCSKFGFSAAVLLLVCGGYSSYMKHSFFLERNFCIFIESNSAANSFTNSLHTKKWSILAKQRAREHVVQLQPKNEYDAMEA